MQYGFITLPLFAFYVLYGMPLSVRAEQPIQLVFGTPQFLAKSNGADFSLPITLSGASYIDATHISVNYSGNLQYISATSPLTISKNSQINISLDGASHLQVTNGNIAVLSFKTKSEGPRTVSLAPANSSLKVDGKQVAVLPLTITLAGLTAKATPTSPASTPVKVPHSDQHALLWIGSTLSLAGVLMLARLRGRN